jgi:hypothetical protein
MSSPSTLETLAREMARLFEPIGALGRSSGLEIYDGSEDGGGDFRTHLDTGSAPELVALTIPPLRRLATLLQDAGIDAEAVLEDGADALDDVVDALVAAWAGVEPLLDEDQEFDLGTLLDGIEAIEDGVASLSGVGFPEVATDEVVPRLMDHLMIRYLRTHRPGIADLAALVGIIDDRDPDAVPTLHLDRVPQLLSDPVAAVAEHLGWGADGSNGAPPFDGGDLLDRARRMLLGLGIDTRAVSIPADGDDGSDGFGDAEDDTDTFGVALPLAQLDPPSRGEIGLRFAALAATDDALAGLAASLYGTSQPDLTEEPDGGTAIEVRAEAAGFAVGVRPGEPPGPIGDAPVVGELSIEVRPPARDEPRSLVRLGGLGGIEVGDLALRLVVATDEDGGHVRLALQLSGAAVRLQPDEADGFLSALLPSEGFAVGADVEIGWSSDTGLYLGVGGAQGLEAELPIGLRVGGVLKIDTLHLRLEPDGTTLELSVGVAGSARLGPLTAVVDRVGFTALLHLEPDDQDPPPGTVIGPVTLEPRFQPPTAIGLAIDAGPLRGGGFVSLDPEAGRYEGALQLQLTEIGIHALGLVETQLPGGEDGYSLLLVLRSEFPPITLPYGFLLTAVGGLVGLQRRIDVDELRERFASGTVGNILAPQDPIGNAPALLEELGAVFPAAAGTFVVGPTLQLGWTTVVRFDLGVFIELPGPSKVVLLGSARAAIDHPGGGTPYLQLRLDILGVLDPVAQTLEFDAVLIDSHLLEVFELTGGAAFRLHWGSPPHVVLSLGGFHPRYDPAPLEFPSSLTRIAMTRGRRSDNFYLRFEGYLAVTANAFQLGAAAEIIVRAGRFVAEGSFGFDVLVRFQPFSFELDLRASLRISYKSKTLAGVKVTGSLHGPGPVEFSGTLEFRILFVTISWSGSFSFGSSTPPPLQPVTDLVAAFEPALADPANLRAVGGDDRDVLLELTADDRDRPVLSPLGRMSWQQNLAPLELLLERFEGAPVSSPGTLHLDGQHVVGREHEHFAPGMFVELSDAERVERGGYEEQVAGVVLAAADPVIPPAVPRGITFEEYRIPDPSSSDGDGRMLAAWALTAVEGGVPAAVHTPPAVAVHRARHELRDESDGRLRSSAAVPDPGGGPGAGAGSRPATGVSEAQAHQLARYDRPGASVGLVDDVLPTPSL